MTIKKIDRDTCEPCPLRTGEGCPVMDACHTDAIRLDEEGFPYIAYPGDCDSCFLCFLDCPYEAVEVSAEVPLPFLTRSPADADAALRDD